MKSRTQPKPLLAQLNLPLMEPAALALPADKDQQLTQALIELLLGAAAQGENHGPQTDR